MTAGLHRLLVVATASLPALGWAMEIQWTRMAGQWPVEASPLVGQFSPGGKEEILVLNQGGQLLLWASNGKAIGPGQDGMVAQLPEGRWLTAPTLIESDDGARFMVANVKGLVVGLDRKFQLLWQFKLPGGTAWGRAVPALVHAGSGSAFVFTDLSGTVTCLKPNGEVAWTNGLEAGSCKAPARAVSLKRGEDSLLVPAGSTLFCCDAVGGVRWRRDLGTEILTRPEMLSLADQRLILCGTASGSLFALDLDGNVLWECKTGDTFSNWIVFLPRANAEPLILFTGLWGNLHAVDVHGRPVWTHLFRAKTRAAPLVLDAHGEGHFEVFIPTFHQRLFVFGEHGEFNDDIRLSGIMPSALVPITDAASGRTDLLVTTTTLLAYRLRPGPPKSPYGSTPEPHNVSLLPPAPEELHEHPALVVRNPDGALIKVHVSLTDTHGWTTISGRLTARSAFEIPLPPATNSGAVSFHATARDATGKILAEKDWTMAPRRRAGPERSHPDGLDAWPTPAFGSFRETRLAPLAEELKTGEARLISVPTLYLDEADQGAFIVASTRDQPMRARVTISRLARKDGVVFGGTIVLREMIPTGSVNGENVPDALPALGDAGLITLPPQRSAKIWISLDARGAQPGNYTGQVSIASLDAAVSTNELPMNIEVVNLRLPREFPLKLCTWDYVPNRWFPSRTREVLDDMARHGVNVFPRTIIPPARLDAAGKLTIDWPVLDAELDRLNQRGRMLLQLGHPPIEFAVKTTEAEKRPVELDYIRKLRDHLREHGRGYPDYAFYLLDEPGLDNGPNIAILVDLGKLFREADLKLLTYTDPVSGLSWKDFERIEPLVDVWAPNMHLVSGLLSGDPRIQRIMKAKTVWSYECIAQVKSLSPLCYNRANAWRAKFFGLSGIGFWTHSTTDVNPWFAGKGINDEFALVYPGELPVPSARWEAVRDGLEDIAAVALLEEQIQRHRQAGTPGELVQKAQETLRVALRDVMDLSEEPFIESRDFLRAGDRVLTHTWTDLEMYRHHRAEIARLTLALSIQ